jgi:hypothetical protein
MLSYTERHYQRVIASASYKMRRWVQIFVHRISGQMPKKFLKLDQGRSVCIFSQFFKRSEIVQSVQRWATRWRAGIWFVVWTRNFSLLHSVQSGSEAHLDYDPMDGYREPFLGGWGGWGVMLTTSLHLVPRSRMVEQYLHFTIRLHGMVLN